MLNHCHLIINANAMKGKQTGMKFNAERMCNATTATTTMTTTTKKISLVKVFFLVDAFISNLFKVMWWCLYWKQKTGTENNWAHFIFTVTDRFANLLHICWMHSIPKLFNLLSMIHFSVWVIVKRASAPDDYRYCPSMKPFDFFSMAYFD